MGEPLAVGDHITVERVPMTVVAVLSGDRYVVRDHSARQRREHIIRRSEAVLTKRFAPNVTVSAEQFTRDHPELSMPGET